MLKNNVIEICTGIVTIIFIFAISFFAIQDFRAFHQEKCMHISAKFTDVAGLNIGSTVELFGVVVGSVTKISADLDAYSAKVELCIDNGLSVPSDSILKIEDKTVLGERRVVLILGVDNKSTLQNGQVITNTQIIPTAGSVVGSLVTKFNGM